MVLKGTEEFVAESLKVYFSKKHSNASYREGENPPDIYLKLSDGEIPIEISDLDENTIKGNRSTAHGYFTFLKELNSEFGTRVPKNMVLLITFYHFHTKANKIKRQFKKYLIDLIPNLEIEKNFEVCIDNRICVSLRVSESKATTQKIQGTVSSYGLTHKKTDDVSATVKLCGNFDLDVNTQNLIMERIATKTEKCRYISQPIWLALNDKYYNLFTDFESNKHLEHYKNVFNKIHDFSIFEKIFIIFENGDVLERTP